MDQLFLKKLEQHQLDSVKLLSGHRISPGLNLMLSLIGLNFLKFALPISFLVAIIISIVLKDSLFLLGKHVLLLPR